MLGGVQVPHHKGAIGHSDADVLLHAICDALIGAAGLGDIGTHFPDTDVRYKGANSRELLRHVRELIALNGYAVQNVDCTIIAQEPKMAPHIPAMRETIALDLRIDATSVNVKAKTAERLGAIGRGEGIAAEAVVLIDRWTEAQSD